MAHQEICHEESLIEVAAVAHTGSESTHTDTHFEKWPRRSYQQLTRNTPWQHHKPRRLYLTTFSGIKTTVWARIFTGTSRHLVLSPKLLSEPQLDRRLVSNQDIPPNRSVRSIFTCSPPGERFIERLIPALLVAPGRDTDTHTRAPKYSLLLLQCSLILHSGCWEPGQASRILPPTPAAS